MISQMTKKVVGKLLSDYKKLGFNMRIKMHFRIAILTNFQVIFGAVGDEYEEKFPQDILMEGRY